MWHSSIGWRDNIINSLKSCKELPTTQLMTHHLGLILRLKIWDVYISLFAL